MSAFSPDSSDSFPWYLKAVILLAVLIVLYIVGVDLLTFLSEF